MKLTKILLSVLLVCCMLTAAIPVSADSAWPQKDVQIVVPANAGGGTDIVARIIASYLAAATGKNFTVVNQPSGSGLVAYETVRNAKPDGSTLLFWHTGFYVNYYSEMYDYAPNTDFTPISMLNNPYTSQVFVVKADAPYSNITELAEAAKAAPDTITYGCQMGGSAQMIAEMLMKATDSELRLVDAASQTDKITGVLGGVIDVTAITTAAAVQYVESGDMKVIGIVDGYSDSRYPDFVTCVDQGYPTLQFTQNLCLYGPAGMDEEIVRQIAALMADLQNDETAVAQLTEAKMIMYPVSYEESMTQFAETDELVRNACDGVNWD